MNIDAIIVDLAIDPFSCTVVASAPAAFASYLTADRSTQRVRVRVSGATLN